MADVIAQQVGRLAFEVDEKGLQQFNRGLETAKGSSDAFGVKAVALGNIVAGLAEKAARAAIAIGQDLVVGFAESGVEIDRMAKRTDLSTTALQRWNAAARKAGVEPEAATKAVEVLNKNLAELALKGSGPAKDALGLLGVEFSELAGLDTEQQLNVIADALAGVPDAGDRASLTMQLFGEEAGKLAPILAQGRQGLDALGDAAEKAGLVLDQKAVESAKRTKAALGSIDKTTTALGNTIAVALAPAVADVAERFGGWYRANEELIAQKIPEVVDTIVGGLTELVEWGQELAGGIDNLTGLFVRLGEEGEGTGVALIGVLETLVGWSKAGIETFVEWTEDVAELAEFVWDLGEAITDGLVVAYEAAEGVIDQVSAAIMEQLGFLDPVVDVLEGIVDRIVYVRDLVVETVDAVGLGRAVSPEELRKTIDDARGPARAARYEAERRQMLQQREADKLLAIAEDERQDQALAAQRRRGAKYSAGLKAPKGGGTNVDTREAEARLGAEITALAQASGATDKARRAAVVAAAKQLDEGAGDDVARQAAASVLTGKTGVDLSNQSADAALFGRLTQIGGADAARHATDGARFVTIDQSQHNNITVQVPEQFGAALTPDGAAEVFTTAVRRILTDDYRQIIERGDGALSP